ncbi:universal stress protein [Pusillimonas sp.]|uniref:universal stress protein n=1 Tax=Pusillimonas sp. TaxID=3040095 RepID=UPI0029A94532|nr:universal stress protein [Pusillimonas sp.]MDX3893823.1 universal stress protein [Pusillimonas sp.]
MPINTILVALALDDTSKRIADRAVQLADQHKAQLVGVHVVEKLHLHASDLPAPLDAQALAGMVEDRGARQLKSLLKKAATSIVHVESGKPHEVIERLARSHGADLIVIGPGVAKNLREKVFGSTADRVVRCATCPVLVVRKDSYAPYRRIAVGVDCSGPGRAAALWAARLSPMASRRLIHSVEIPLSFEQAMMEAGTSRNEIDQYLVAKARTAQEKMLVSYGENGKLPPRTRIRIVHGDPALTLLEASRRTGTDLVALGAQGSNAVARHLLGSVARKVLVGAKCDVLVIPAAAS